MGNKDLIIAQNSVTTVLEHQKLLWNGVQNIDSSLSKNEIELKRNLVSLENAEAKIEVSRHWYGTVDIDSICESLNNVYDDLRKYIQTCGSAIRTTNENLSHTLGLIRILAMIEKDLYEQLDNEVIQGNVLKDLIRDWCKKNNIRDEEVNSLLETSFQRAYTLRDRINNIKGEVLKKLAHYDSELSKLTSNVESLKSFVSSEKAKTLKELSDLYSLKESMFIKLSSEKKNDLLRLHESNVQTINKLSHGITEKMNDFIKTLKTQNDDASKLNAEIKKALNNNIKDLNEKQNEAINEIDRHSENSTIIIDDLSSKFKSFLSTQETVFDDKVKSALELNNNALQTALSELSSEYQKKIAQFNDLYESIQKTQNSYKEDIENDKASFSSQVESSLSKLNEKLDLALNEVVNVSENSQQQVLFLQKQIISEHEEANSNINEKIDSFEQNLKHHLDAQKKEFDSILNSQKAMFADELSKAHANSKRLVILGSIAGILVASAISFAINLML